MPTSSPPSTAAKLINFVLFQVVWFAAIEGAAEGLLLVGPFAAITFAVLHLVQVDERERPLEFAYLAGVTLLGALLDTGLFALGVTNYPTSGAGADGAWLPELAFLPPPWILSLWLAFACLPRFSLAWMRGRYRLAAAFGAIGGPLSYLAGVRLGAVGLAESPALSILGLATEYALVTPLLLFLAPAFRGTPVASPSDGARGAVT